MRSQWTKGQCGEVTAKIAHYVKLRIGRASTRSCSEAMERLPAGCTHRRCNMTLYRSVRIGKTVDDWRTHLVPRSPAMKLREVLLTLALSSAVVASAHEGMWTPQQLPQIAGALRATGLASTRRSSRDLTAYPNGRHRQPGRLHGLVRLAAGPRRYEPSLRLRQHPVQLDGGAEPDRTGLPAGTPADELPAAPGSRVFVTDRQYRMSPTASSIADCED